MTVAGIGALGRRIDGATAARLAARAAQARFGRRTETLTDPTVRDTGEIRPEDLTIAWHGTACEDMLDAISARLGCGPVEARPHSLLVYGPGQFFKPHQDTEKHDGMIGTLVLILPSPHIGGTLRIRHTKGEHSRRSICARRRSAGAPSMRIAATRFCRSRRAGGWR